MTGRSLFHRPALVGRKFGHHRICPGRPVHLAHSGGAHVDVFAFYPVCPDFPGSGRGVVPLGRGRRPAPGVAAAQRFDRGRAHHLNPFDQHDRQWMSPSSNTLYEITTREGITAERKGQGVSERPAWRRRARTRPVSGIQSGPFHAGGRDQPELIRWMWTASPAGGFRAGGKPRPSLYILAWTVALFLSGYALMSALGVIR